MKSPEDIENVLDTSWPRVARRGFDRRARDAADRVDPAGCSLWQSKGESL